MYLWSDSPACVFFSGKPKFDLTLPRQPLESTGPAAEDTDVTPAPEEIIATINPEICPKVSPPKEWEVDVRGMISTKKWLQTYGLKKNRLDMHHLLPQIGFKHSDGNYKDWDMSAICLIRLCLWVCALAGNGGICLPDTWLDSDCCMHAWLVPLNSFQCHGMLAGLILYMHALQGVELPSTY